MPLPEIPKLPEGAGSALAVAGALFGGGGPKGIQRIGDISSGGGIIVGPGQDDVRVNNRPIAMALDVVTPHWGCSPQTWWHCVTFTTGQPGSKTVRASGRPLVLDGDLDTCIDHSRMMGSKNVRAS